MNLELKGKTALISGSSRGIGYAIAEALANAVRVDGGVVAAIP